MKGFLAALTILVMVLSTGRMCRDDVRDDVDPRVLIEKTVTCYDDQGVEQFSDTGYVTFFPGQVTVDTTTYILDGGYCDIE